MAEIILANNINFKLYLKLIFFTYHVIRVFFINFDILLFRYWRIVDNIYLIYYLYKLFEQISLMR